MSQVCSNCGGSDIDFDPSRGNAVCINCGSVLEDNIIVSEVQFQENSIGGTSAIGQFVSAEGNKTVIGLGTGFRHGLGQESRAVTLENGRKRINNLGHQLQMNQHCIDTAFNFYKLAVNKRLTRGRRINHVIAACLYLVCRTEKTPHMLLDFSDVLQIDVFTLGRAYLKLAQELYINLPALDPCLYIHRFAHKLEFGDKEHDVAMTALRLVSRMKRDWIHHGRRPSGLCGAALLVAARFHNFSRSVKEVVKVVRISNTTIRKRLGEFKDTPSSLLTIDEFQKIDLEEEQDPPCFIQSRRKAKQQSEDLNDPGVTNELKKFQLEIENILGISKLTCDKEQGGNELQIEVKEPNPSVSTTNNETTTWSRSREADCDGFQAATERRTYSSYTQEEENNDGELDLSGLDDKELDGCLLTNEEIEIKTKIWMEENQDYLEKIKEKEEKEAREKEQGINKPEPKKKRKPKAKKGPPAATAGEAIEKMLVEKKISTKINYEVLRDLETSQSIKDEKQADPVLQLDPPPSSPRRRLSTGNHFLVPDIPVKKGQIKRDASEAPNAAEKSKKQKLLLDEKAETSLSKLVELVVESGPVDYTGTEPNTLQNDDPVEEGDYFDDEEDGHVSAAQLLGTMYSSGAEEEFTEYEEDY